MATRISSLLWFILFSFSAFLCLYADEAEETTESHNLHHSHTVQVSSLIPSTTCSASIKGPKRKASLEVIHKYGPCLQSNQDEVQVPSHMEILLQDQNRVNSINSRLSKNSDSNKLRDSQAQASTLPANSGRTLGTGNYFVTGGLGTPRRDLRLVFDTGSDLTWTQCEPCAVSCYSQVDPIFDPSKSTSYSNIPCPSPLCSQLTSATGNPPKCSSTSTCLYLISYGDNSSSIGYFSKEKLSITSSDELENFLFGCGQGNQGLFRGTAGLLGLGRDKISIVQQAAQKYGQFFSYCLPSTPSSTGYLTFGNEGVSNTVKFTPLLTLSREPSFYGLGLTGISVGGRQLSIETSVFSATGTIIDSGTVITRLPPTAYSALRTAFREAMSGYPTTSPSSLLDTCYDLSKNTTVLVPRISFLFDGGVSVDLDPVGVLYVYSLSQVCLAFAGNSDAGAIGIIGNVQQKKFEVVYDVAGGRIGFGPGGCG